MVSSTPRPHFTPGKDPVPILQEAGWAPEPVWTGGKSRPHRDSIPGPSSPQSVALPTELPGPQSLHNNVTKYLPSASLIFRQIHFFLPVLSVLNVFCREANDLDAATPLNSRTHSNNCVYACPTGLFLKYSPTPEEVRKKN